MAGGYAVAHSEADWQAESDMRTLIEAEKIRQDKKRYDAAMKCYRKESKAMKAMEGKKK